MGEEEEAAEGVGAWSVRENRQGGNENCDTGRYDTVGEYGEKGIQFSSCRLRKPSKIML